MTIVWIFKALILSLYLTNMSQLVQSALIAWKVTFDDGDWWCQIKLYVSPTFAPSTLQSDLSTRFEMAGDPYISSDPPNPDVVTWNDGDGATIVSNIDTMESQFSGAGESIQENVQSLCPLVNGQYAFEVSLQPDLSYLYLDEAAASQVSLVRPKKSKHFP